MIYMDQKKKSNKQLTLISDAYKYGRESGLYFGFICGYLSGIIAGVNIVYYRNKWLNKLNILIFIFNKNEIYIYLKKI